MSYYQKYLKYKNLYLTHKAGSDFLSSQVPKEVTQHITKFLPIDTDISVTKKAPRKKKGTLEECAKNNLQPYQYGCLNPIPTGDYSQTICCRDTFYQLPNTDSTNTLFDFDLFYRYCFWSFDNPERLTYTIRQLFDKCNQNRNITIEEDFLTSLYDHRFTLDVPIELLLTSTDSDPSLALVRFHIFRIVFGIKLPNINNNAEGVRCEWNKELWSLYYTVLLFYHYKFQEIDTYITESDLEVYNVFYEEVTSGDLDNFSFDGIYGKLLEEADMDSMIRDYPATLYFLLE